MAGGVTGLGVVVKFAPKPARPAAQGDHRRTGFRPTVPDRRGTALRGLQPALRGGLHHGDHQPAFRRVDRGLRLGTAHRRAAGPAHPPRAHPGDERPRATASSAARGERCSTSPGRIRQPISPCQKPSSLTPLTHSLTHPSLLPACLCDTSPEQLARTFTLANDLSGGTFLLRPTGMFCRRP